MKLEDAELLFKKILKSHPRDIRGLAGVFLFAFSIEIQRSFYHPSFLHHLLRTLAGLGAVYVQMRKFAEARPLLEDALAFDAEYAEARFFLGESLVGLGEANKAIEHYKKVLTFLSNVFRYLNNDSRQSSFEMTIMMRTISLGSLRGH
jgi:tetratricopeptide (TPR) repeat protein